MKDIVVISLFDGLSGGRCALDNVSHLNVLRYYSSEIDKYAIQIANKNYPQDKKYRLGSVVDIDPIKLLKKIHADFGQDIEILLMGGSPCQGFSMAGKLRGSSTASKIDVVSLEQYLQLKMEGVEFDGQSYLFWEYIRIKEAINPDYFLLENVKVTKKWLPMFNNAVGCEGRLINSNTLSAQDRPRFYWSNINFSDPIPTNREFKAILENKPIDQPLSPYMTKNFNGVSRLKKGIFNFTERSKGVCQTTGSGHGCKYVILGNPNNPIAKRKLTPIEQERLQTLPDNYTEGVPIGRREHMIGNGWTIKIIVYILKGM